MNLALEYGVPWFIARIEGCDMKQVNTFALYRLANQLTPLRGLPLDPKSLTKEQHGWTLALADYWLGQFFVDNPVIPLEISGDAASALRAAMNVISTKLWADGADPVTDWEVRSMATKLEELETALSLELQRHQTYLVSQVGGYSMSLLIAKAKSIFSKMRYR